MTKLFIQECHLGNYLIQADNIKEAFKAVKNSFDYWGAVAEKGEEEIDRRGYDIRTMTHIEYQALEEELGKEIVDQDIYDTIRHISSFEELENYIDTCGKIAGQL